MRWGWGSNLPLLEENLLRNEATQREQGSKTEKEQTLLTLSAWIKPRLKPTFCCEGQQIHCVAQDSLSHLSVTCNQKALGKVGKDAIYRPRRKKAPSALCRESTSALPHPTRPIAQLLGRSLVCFKICP